MEINMKDDAKAKGKGNVIFILIDALRKDRVNSKSMPSLWDFAQKASIFNNCFACINASDPALTAIETGLYPWKSGLIHHSYEIEDEEITGLDKIEFIQEYYQRMGYKTYGLDFLGRFHKRGFDYYTPLGVDRTKRKKLLNRLSKIIPFFKKIHSMRWFRKIVKGFDLYPKDEEVIKKAIEIMDSEKNPYFLFIHLWSVHKPYRGSYDEAVSFLDKQFLEVLSRIRADDTAIIMADHGEMLGEHVIYFDHHGLYDEVLNVPLIIKSKRLPIGVDSRLFSVIDVTQFLKGFDFIGREYIYAMENWYEDRACVRTLSHKLIIGDNKCRKCGYHHIGNVLFKVEDESECIKNEFIRVRLDRFGSDEFGGKVWLRK